MTCKSYWPGNGNAEGLEVHLARQIEHHKLLTIDPGCLSSFRKTQKHKDHCVHPTDQLQWNRGDR